MKRILISVLFAVLYLFPVANSAVANETFDISSDTTFTVNSDGKTRVTQRIEITNNTEYYYTPSYGMTISYSDIENVQVFGSTGAIPFAVTDAQEGKKIDITFRDRIVGLNRKNIFTISFDTGEVAHKNGSVWEITIPGVRNISDFLEYTVTLNVPSSLGKPTIIKPQKNYQANGNTIQFDKSAIGESGIFVIFGTEQYYAFELDYHITNNNLFPIQTEIALPPTTNYQEVHIEKISPAPLDVYQDSDGNWLAEYNLSSQQKKTIHVKGVVKVGYKPTPVALSSEHRKKYTASLPYWEVTSKEIKEAVHDLDNPKEIYEYVVKTLSYNYDKVTGDNTRLGAKEALQNPKNAVCLEFTDLFVALARAKGIPARSIEGYAHTENERLRPLSLVNDVLHAWPEYYDDKKQAWIMVDPTWGNTTGGTDYFDVFDFDHIVFVRKGEDSKYPIPAGGYKFKEESKDIKVSFAGKNDFQSKSFVSLQSNIPDTALSAFPIRGHIVVYNTGNSALYNKAVRVTSELELEQSEFMIDVIPPFGKSVILLDFKKTPLLTNKEYAVTIQFEDYVERKNVAVSMLPHQKSIILGGIAGVGFIILLIIAGKTRSIYLQRRG